jgi:hypothetical protein
VFDSLGEEKKSEEDLETEKNERGAVSEDKLRHAEIRKQAVDSIRGFFEGKDCFMSQVLSITKDANHIMEFTYMRVLEAMFSLVRTGISNLLKYRDERQTEAQIGSYMKKFFIYTIIWGVGGSLNLKERTAFSNKLSEMVGGKVEMPSTLRKTDGFSLIDYCVRVDDQEWHNYVDFIEDE